jgi:asparagine synthase (glutamine-hydrolysing)
MTLGLDGFMQRERYWSLESVQPISISLDQAKEQFRTLFEESLRTRMQADVPVGVSLSGGLDSSAITCGIRSLLPNEEIRTFSARFKDAALDEGHHIQKVVEQTGAVSFSVIPDEDTLLNDVERVLYHQEAPFSSASVIAQWEVYKLAAKAGMKVLIDGQGSDEYLAGYKHFYGTYFKQLYRSNYARYEKESSILLRDFNLDYHLNFRQKCEASYPQLFSSLQNAKLKYLGSKKDENLDRRFIRQYQDSRIVFKNYTSLKEATLDFTTHYGLHKLLRFADRNSMGHSLEVRLPFLRHQLVEFVYSLPSEFLINEGWSKFILRESMKDVMPNEITWRRDKLGFQAPQIDWLKSPKVKAIVEDGRRSLESHHILKKNAKGVSDWDIMILHLFMRQ